MPQTVLQLDPRDNLLVALANLAPGDGAHFGAQSCPITEAIPAKHKLALVDLNPGDLVYLYGMIVGETAEPVARGSLLTPRNVRHRAGAYTADRKPAQILTPDASAFADRTFMGFHRADGQVGTRNYWLVLPLVFCENRNIQHLKEALEEELGYGNRSPWRQHVRRLIEQNKTGGPGDAWSQVASAKDSPRSAERVFPNIDGIRFLTHEGGCGGTRQDAQALCGLLAGYIHHPQRRRRNRPQPRLPECAILNPHGRAPRPRPANVQARPPLRSAKLRP